MTAFTEVTRANRWITTTLRADPTLAGLIGTRVYDGPAPANATYPFVSFELLSAPDSLYGNGPTIIWQKLIYVVKAISKTDSVTSLQTIADRIAAVLHAQHGATSDSAIDYCVRRRPFRMQTIENGERWQHLGHEFELAVRASDV